MIQKSNPRNSLKSKVKTCSSCKIDRPVWKNLENKQPVCKQCAEKIAAKKPKTTKPKKDKVVKISKLLKDLDTIFSIYTRLKDSDENGYTTCCTCGKVEHWKKTTNGHGISRRNHNTKFNEQNTHAQCIACNIYGHGEVWKYSKYVDNRYGEGTFESLYQLSQEPFKYTRSWVEEKISYYKQQVEQLKKQKGLE